MKSGQRVHSIESGWLRPALVLAAALAITAVLWALQERSHRGRLNLETEVTAEQAGTRLSDWINDRMNLSAYLAERWSSEYAEDPERYERDAGQFARQFPGIQAINWVDASQVIRIVVPRESNQSAFGVDLSKHPNADVREAIARALSGGTLERTPAVIDLLQGGKGFATYLPVFGEDGRHLGFINAVFRVNDLVQTCLGGLLADRRFVFAIREIDGSLVYPVGERGGYLDGPDVSSVTIEVAGRPWRFSLAPSPSYLRFHRLAVHHLILPAGLIAALLLAGFDRVLVARKRALESSRAQYRTLFEQAPVAYLTVRNDGAIDRANTVAERLSGFSRSALSGKDIYDLFPETGPSRTQARVLLDAVRRGGTLHQAEIQMRRADGMVFWAHLFAEGMAGDDGDAGMFRLAITDITERRDAEDVRRRLSAAIEQAEEGLIITDRSGVIVYINRAARGIHPGAAAAGPGDTIETYLRRQHLEESSVAAIGAAMRDEIRWRESYALPAGDENTIQISATLTPVRDESGAVLSFVFLQRDISLEVELQTQLQQVRKMDAIGRFAGGIAHDFNNILQSLLGYASLARRNLADPVEVGSCLEEIERAGYRAADLVSHILAFGRQLGVDRRALPLRPIVEEVARLVRGSLPEGLSLSVSFSETQHAVVADPTQIHQVLMNLASNALHALRGQGGRLEIGLDAIDLDEIEVTRWPGLKPGPHMRLTLRDSGPGMDDSTLRRIFEPYFTTREVGTGTGLGLATVHGLVEQHGGAIWAESAPGKGACFTIYLPAAAPTTPAPADLPDQEIATPDAAPGGGAPSIRVLYVDDEAQIVDSMRRVLERLGYDVDGYTSSTAALEAFKRAPAQYDLLVTDLTMPGMNGMALAEAVNTLRGDLPIILCSGYGDSYEKEIENNQHFIKSFLKKPVSARVLAGEIKQLTSGNGAGV